jgi:hypothetical protein
MAKITSKVLMEAATEVLKEFDMTPPVGDVSPGRRETPEKIKSDALQPDEGFQRSGFGISSNSFNVALKKLVRDELSQLLKTKEKKSEKKD